MHTGKAISTIAARSKRCKPHIIQAVGKLGRHKDFSADISMALLFAHGHSSAIKSIDFDDLEQLGTNMGYPGIEHVERIELIPN